ncbi:MAG: choice-of-anchor L domain-containing protein, partial [Flavisolibacter sp.]
SGTAGSSYDIGTCQFMGPGSPFTQYFVDNTNNDYFTHNGHTKVLTASSAVQPCKTYHLKIAIADVVDHSYDSGVFLEAESLRSEPLQIRSTLPFSSSGPYLTEGCQQGGVEILRGRASPTPVSVNLVFGGDAINGVDVQTIPSTVTIGPNELTASIPIIPIADHIAEETEMFKIYFANACVQTTTYLDSVQVQIRDFDTLAFAPSPHIGLCSNNGVQLIATAGYDSYQWTPSQTLSNASIHDPLAMPSQSTTYVCTATLGTCSAKDSVEVQLKRLKLLSKKDISCTNGSGEIRVTAGWEWKRPLEFSINGQPFIFDSSFLNLASGKYTVRVRDASGCVDSLLILVEQSFSNLALHDSIGAASCNGTNGSIKLQANGGQGPYLFSIDTGNFVASPQFVVNGGVYTVSVHDGLGCEVKYQVTVKSDPPINFNWITDSTACDGSASTWIHVIATGGEGKFEYSTDGINFQQSDSFQVNSGSLALTVRDSKGCMQTRNVLLPLSEKVFVNAGKDTAICEGASIHFHTTANANSFSWSPSSSVSDATLADPVASPKSTTTYFVAATRGVCTVHDTITVQVWPAPFANAGPDSTICFGKTIRLQGSGGQTYSWFPSSLVSDPALSNPQVRPVQTTAYYLMVYDAHHCPAPKMDTVLIRTVTTVKVFAGKDTTIAVNEPLQLEGKDLGNSGATIFLWSPSTGLNRTDIINPVAILDRDMSYSLKLTTSEGCEGKSEIHIRVFSSPDIFVPSGFTPNGDGKNDILRPIPVGMRALKFFTVYNRWGQIVFSTTTERMGWDGNLKGKNEPVGTYIWIAEAVDYKGNHVQRRGSVTLLR